MGDQNTCPTCGGNTLAPARPNCTSPDWHPVTVIAVPRQASTLTKVLIILIALFALTVLFSVALSQGQ